MRSFLSRLSVAIPLMAGLAGTTLCQQVLIWQQVKDKFESANPSLQAGQIGIDESRAAEITAHLRPNPNLGLSVDQINPFNGGPPHSAAGSLLTVAAVSYWHKRRNKRELRVESAQKATGIAISGQADLVRTLLFTLRISFVQTLQENVDSAYATATSTVKLLQPYQDRYLQQVWRVRDTIAFSYDHGAASLLDFLNAQADYQSVQTNYLNLLASYLDAANQLNLAVGREVLQCEA